MPTLAVTGAAGYIGTRVVQALSRMGRETIAVVHPADAPARIERLTGLPHVRVVPHDVLSSPAGALKAIGSPDAVVHLAWRNGFNHQSPSHLADMMGHHAFLTALLDQGLTHLAVAGTAHEIGFYEGRVTNDTPANPINLYGIAKNFLRQALFAAVAGKDITFQWLRFFCIHGHDEENSSVLSKIAAAAKEGKTTFGLNHGEILYDFIHVERLGEQIAAAASQRDIAGIINCCTGKPVTLKTQVRSFIAERGLKMDLEFGKFPLRAYDSNAIWGDATLIERICARLPKP